MFYNRLDVSGDCDVVMVAPRMIGTSVRSLFVKGQGFPCFVSVEKVCFFCCFVWSMLGWGGADTGGGIGFDGGGAGEDVSGCEGDWGADDGGGGVLVSG